MAGTSGQKSAVRQGGGKVYLRLVRRGPRGSGGPGRYYYAKTGKIYKRSGVYAVPEEHARVLLSTGAFESVREDQVQLALQQARVPRGVTLDQRLRDERDARRATRSRIQPLEEAEQVADLAPAADDSPGVEV